jgi:flagellar biosynthesis protein FliQ
MTPLTAASLMRSALWIVIKAGGPLLLALTATAAIFGVLQAATQVHDASITFFAKISAAVTVAWLGSGWIIGVLSDFMHRVLLSIPYVVNQ